jgi:hypothetical protein
MPCILHALHAAVSCHSLQTSHSTPITQLEAYWRGQDRVCRQHDVPLWPAWGGALARGPTGRAPCGPLRLALRWPLVRSPPARLPPPACTGLRAAGQADGHRGVAATRGVTLWPAGRLPWWTSVAGTARAREKAHARAWRDWHGLACSVVATRPHAPRRSLRSGVGRAVFYCRAVCRGSGRCGRRPMAGEASRVGAARGPLPWPASARCGFSALKGDAR